MVVDDESALVDALRAILEDEGYAVITAANGRDGLARIAETRPDLVLLDTMMPVLDGVGVIREMRASPETRSVPVILMSAGRPTLPDAQRREIVTFFQKPFDLEALLRTIREALAESPA